jgi:creatinine amidohydrolase/Fe(II)-dependent formamide hydrolase-like protein
MYLQGSSGDYTRLDLLPVAVTVSGAVPSGVDGDGRQSSVELGKRAFATTVDYAVRQIRRLTAAEESTKRKP